MFCSLRSPARRIASFATGTLVLLCLVAGIGPRRAQAQASMAQADTTRLTFDEAIRTALGQNTDLKRAQADLRSAETQVQSEWMDFAPDLSIQTEVSRSFGRTFSQEQVGFIQESTDNLRMTGRSSVTIFNGFENISSLREASNQAESNKLGLQRTQREVVFTVMDQYISLIENREIVRVRKEELEARRQQLRQIEEFVDAGSRPVSDLYQEQANVAEAEQRLLQAEREREVSKTRLIQTLQLNPRQAYQFEVPALAADTLSPEGYDLSALMDEAFQQRLDLRAAEAETRASQQNIRSEKADYYPSLSITGSYSTDWTSRPRPIPTQGGGSIEPGFSRQLDNNRNGSVGVSLTIPIFDQFQRETQIERARVEAQNAKYALEDQRQQIALQVRQAYLDYRNAAQQLEAANKRLRAARQARDAAQERYNLGSASIVELQNATRDFVDAASQQVRARYNLIFRKKQIDYHTGRLSPDEPLIGQQDAQ